MTVAVKNNNKTPLVVPTSVRRAAGFKSGQEVEFNASGGVITILPKSPAEEDQCTPAQRRNIDAQLTEAELGPSYGPFNSAVDAVAFLKKELKQRDALKKPKRR